MSDVWNDGETMNEVFSRLTSEDAIKVLILRTEEIVQEADGSVTMQHFDVLRSIISNEKYPKVPYSKDELLAHYDSEDIIIIHQADQELVNTVRSDLGLSDEDADTFGQSGSLEIYGLACIKTEGLKNLFVYVVPRMGDIIASSDVSSVAASRDVVNLEDIALSYDIDSLDIDLPETSSEDKAEVVEIVPEEYTMRDFQLDRWANFFRWMGDLAVEAAKNYDFTASHQIRTADNSTATISDVQSRTFDFSYANVPSDYDYNPREDDFPLFYRTRDNFVSVKIFSAHDFNSGKDYYIVENTTATVPKNFADIMIRQYDETVSWRPLRNYLYGFTKNFGTHFQIDGGKMSTSDVALVHSAPGGKITAGSSEDISWPISGIITVKKDGASAKVDDGVTYTNTGTWPGNDYTIENLSMKDYPANAKWNVDVNGIGVDVNGIGYIAKSYAEPSLITLNAVYVDFIFLTLVNRGTDLSRYRKNFHYDEELMLWWADETCAAASTNPLQYDSYFVWEVGRDYWRNNPDMKMNLMYTVGDGSHLGFCYPLDSFGRSLTADCFALEETHTTTKWDSLTLERPPHTAVDKPYLTLMTEKAGSLSFTLFAEDDWELTTSTAELRPNIDGLYFRQGLTTGAEEFTQNVDWLHFTSTSGEATGSLGKQIVFDVDENPNAGARSATITITSGRDTVNINVVQEASRTDWPIMR